jgi:FKBP-type peptidyl-prolyl cis-trans isomerase 2
MVAETERSVPSLLLEEGVESGMPKARYGDTVGVRYTIHVEEDVGLTVTLARGSEQLTLGEEELFRGSDLVIIGMEVGESKAVRIPAELLFGPCREALVQTLHPEHLPAHLEPEVGQILKMHKEDGPAMPVTVTKVSRLGVTLDAYCPLAGKDLIFEVRLDEIVKATKR